MKMVINACFGGYGISTEAREVLDRLGCDYGDRSDKNLIELIEKEGSCFVSDDYASLQIVEIPDNATDYEIEDYDGMESIIYVVDGLIYHMYA